MDASANRELVQRLYAAMRSGDSARVLELLSGDVVLVVPGPPGLALPAIGAGHAGARECFRRLGEGHVTEDMSFLDLISEGDKVVSRLHVVARVHATGKRFESDIVHLFTVRDGKIVELLDFFDTAALVEAYR